MSFFFNKQNGSIEPVTGAEVLTSAGGIALGEVDVANSYGLSPSNSAATNSAILARAFSDATTGGFGLFVPAGTYPVNNGNVWAGPSCYFRGAGAGKTIFSVSSNTGANAFTFGNGTGTEVGQGRISDFWINAGNSSTVTGYAGFQINSLKFTAVERVAVQGYDIGFDLIGNNYGSYFVNLWCRYSECNCGLNLRTGPVSGNDLPFYNCWIGGAIAGISISPNSSGFNFFGGSFGASGSAPNGSVVYCQDYITGSDAGGVGNVSFNGCDFEGWSNCPAIISYSPFEASYRDCHFLATVTGSNAATNLVSLTTYIGDTQLSFDNCGISGTFKNAALMSMSGTITTKFTLRENGWNCGTPTTINGVSQGIGWFGTLAEQSGLSYGTGFNHQNSLDYFTLNGARIATVAPTPAPTLVTTTQSNASIAIPSRATIVDIEGAGGGGGGGGGFGGATAGGGGGGGLAQRGFCSIPISALNGATSLFYNVGAGGASGAANGAGGNGGDTYVGTISGPGDIFFLMSGGAGGNAGASGSGGSGGGGVHNVQPFAGGVWYPNATGGAGGTSAAGSAGGNSSGNRYGGSGGGGGGANSGTPTAGGAGGGITGVGAAGTAGGSTGGTGGTPTDNSALNSLTLTPDGGGGGGGGGGTTTGGPGGPGGKYGGGAGGGGGGTTTGGIGGVGGVGYLKITFR